MRVHPHTLDVGCSGLLGSLQYKLCAQLDDVDKVAACVSLLSTPDAETFGAGLPPILLHTCRSAFLSCMSRWMVTWTG